LISLSGRRDLVRREFRLGLRRRRRRRRRRKRRM
jgi:hypothetical protein